MSVRNAAPRPKKTVTSTRRSDSSRRLHQIAVATRCASATVSTRAGPSAAATASAASTKPEWLTDVRKQLPLTDQLIYMQTGGHGPALDSVLKAAATAAEDDAHIGMPVTTGVRPEFFKAAGLGSGMSGSAATQARQALGELLGCSPDAVAVLNSTSIALYTVIMASQWGEGDELIISNLEHVCVASIAQGLEARYGVKVTAVPADEGDQTFLAALAATVTSRTRLVVLSHVASPTGHVLPVADAVATVHKHASEASPQCEDQLPPRVVIDGAQAVGQIPVDVTVIGCDYYIGSGHKWLCGPSGTAFLYISHDAMEHFWPYPRNHHAPWPDHEPTANSTAASRVEVGTSCVANVVGLGEALKLWSQHGAAARKHVIGLANRLKTAAATISGIRVLTPMDPARSTGLTTLSFDGMTRENLMELVYNLYTKHNINVKFQYLETMYNRSSTAHKDHVGMRVSLAFFNTISEVETLLDALTTELSAFALSSSSEKLVAKASVTPID